MGWGFLLFGSKQQASSIFFGWEATPWFLDQIERTSLHGHGKQNGYGRDVVGVLGVFQVPVDREGYAGQVKVPPLPKAQGQGQEDNGLSGNLDFDPPSRNRNQVYFFPPLV